MSGPRSAVSPAPAARRGWLVLVAFFVSGASSLVFQTLWSRLLQHVFGASSLAISSVVSVFMAGLGLGAFYVGKRADRIRDPLLWYALAELGVGVASLLVPWVLRPEGWLATANAALRHSFGVSSALFVLARFLCIVPVLIVPTFLMGATLPLLARHVVAHSSSGAQASREVGQLYAVNTLGAVLGVLGSSFVLLPCFGVSVANTSAACTNFALAALVFWMRHTQAVSQAPLAAAGAPLEAAAGRAQLAVVGGDSADPEAPASVRVAAALAFALSGFASLLYEVVWSRALISTIGGSLYSFALILATFLVGIALGSGLASLSVGDRLRARGVHVASGALLCLLAAAPLLTRAAGRLGFLLAAVGGALGMFGLAWLQRDRARRERTLGAALDSSRERPWLLTVPVLVALAVCLRMPGRLSALTLGVVAASCVLLILLETLRRQPLRLLVALQVFVAAATFMSDLTADELSLTFASMVVPLYDALSKHVGTVQALMCGTAALCVLPAALGMGAVFPVALRVFSSGGERIAREVGVLYTGNTLGSIVGAWLPGFVLMPWLGMQATLHIGMATNLLVALALVCVGWRATRVATTAAASSTSGWLAALGLAAALVLLALATLHPPRFLAWNIARMTLGAFRVSLAREVLDEEAWGEPELVYHRDGLSTTVTVERWGRHYTLKNNGKVDASNGDDMATQIMVAALPLLMHTDVVRGLDVAVIGFGSGVTVGATLQFPVRDVEVIELERATIEGSRFFANANHLDYVSASFPYVRAPRLRVVNDDARNHLAATAQHYDVIVSEPSNPWLTGVSDLFTADHFRVAKRKLKPQGVYCQWAQLYELSPENVKTLYRTFAGAFRYVVVFAADELSSDTILLGSDSPLPLDLSRVRRAFADPRAARELQRAGVRTPFDVFARVLLANRAELLAFTRGAAINTDDNARIELAAPRDLIGFERYKGYLQSMYAPSWPYARIADALIGFGTQQAGSQNYSRQALALLAQGRKSQAQRVMQRASMHAASSELEQVRAVYAASTAAANAGPLPMFVTGERATPRDTAPAVRGALVVAYDEALRAVAQRDYRAALAALRSTPEHLRRAAGSEWSYLEGYLRFETGDHAAAAELFEALMQADESFALRHPPLLFFVARSQDKLLRFDGAVRNFLSFVQSREHVGEFVPGSSGSQVPTWVLSR